MLEGITVRRRTLFASLLDGTKHPTHSGVIVINEPYHEMRLYTSIAEAGEKHSLLYMGGSI